MNENAIMGLLDFIYDNVIDGLPGAETAEELAK